MPWRRARPLRGSTNPAWPGGTAMAIPVGTSARPPPAGDGDVLAGMQVEPGVARWA